jgi:myo-inositol 2-dehydrogenase/D-chiro-inositol 1-dehydrogenase
MDVGVIGAGRIGKLHMSILKNHNWVDTIAVYDPLLDAAWAKDSGYVSCHSLDELLSQSLDAVIIASPSDQHLEHIEKAVKANCAILCEKPIGLDLKLIQSTLNKVNEAGAFLQIGFNRRFDANFAAMQRSIKQSKDTPQVIKVTSRDPHCPPASYLKSSGGLFMDMAIHDFDMVCFLSNAKPIAIASMGSCTVESGLSSFADIDTAVTLIRFDTGAMAMIDNCRQALYGYDQRAEVYSNNQQWVVDNPRQHAVESWRESGQSTAALNPFFLERYHQAYQDQIHTFLDCVKHKKNSVVTGEDGLTAVKMAFAAKQSLTTGDWVTI